MKKIGLAVLCVALLGILIWCMVPKAPQEQPRSIRIDGIVYDCTDQETEAPLEKDMIGHVTSAVERTKLPQEDGQVNFPEAVGQPYALVEGQLIVYFENAWHLCVQVYG